MRKRKKQGVEEKRLAENDQPAGIKNDFKVQSGK